MARQYCKHPCHTIQSECLWLNSTAIIHVILSSRSGYGQTILQSSMSYYLVRVAMARHYCNHPCHTILQEQLWFRQYCKHPCHTIQQVWLWFRQYCKHPCHTIQQVGLRFRQYCKHPCHTILSEWLWLDNTAHIPVILSSMSGYGLKILQASLSYYLVGVAMVRQYCNHPCHTILSEWLWLDNTASIPVILSSRSGYG